MATPGAAFGFGPRVGQRRQVIGQDQAALQRCVDHSVDPAVLGAGPGEGDVFIGAWRQHPGGVGRAQVGAAGVRVAQVEVYRHARPQVQAAAVAHPSRDARRRRAGPVIEPDARHGRVGRRIGRRPQDAHLLALANSLLPVGLRLTRDAAVLVHVGHLVHPLVPDAAGVAPVAVGVTQNQQAPARRRAQQIGGGRAHHDLGLAVVVHVGDGGIHADIGDHVVQPQFVAGRAAGPVQDEDPVHVVEDQFGRSILVKVKGGRGRRRIGPDGGVDGQIALPDNGAVGSVDGQVDAPGVVQTGGGTAVEAHTAGHGDLGPPIAVEIRHRGWAEIVGDLVGLLAQGKGAHCGCGRRGRRSRADRCCRGARCCRRSRGSWRSRGRDRRRSWPPP